MKTVAVPNNVHDAINAEIKRFYYDNTPSYDELYQVLLNTYDETGRLAKLVHKPFDVDTK